MRQRLLVAVLADWQARRMNEDPHSPSLLVVRSFPAPLDHCPPGSSPPHSGSTAPQPGFFFSNQRLFVY